MTVIRATDLARSGRRIRGMRRLPLLAVILLVPSTAHADGCPPSQCATATVAVPGSPMLAVRPAGLQGPAAVYDLRAGRRAFDLPSGMLSADGRHHFSTRQSPSELTVDHYDARTARRLDAWSLPGRWWLNAVSADARHLVFTQSDKRRTHFLVTAADGRVEHAFALRGRFEVEAVARDAARLYLVQWFATGYVVRAYDVRTRSLRTIRAGRDPAFMRGSAWASVPSADGRWLLTLYLESAGEIAIHALDVVRGRAACIDLPEASFEEARHYTLVVAPNGRTAVAANPATGLVARVDLARSSVESVSRFRAVAQTGVYGGTAAVGRGRVHFAAERDVWSYDLRTGTVGGPVKVRRRVVGLGVDPARGALRIVTLGGKVTTLET
jgi:hypothetical protein